MEKKRPRLKTDELRQLRWLLGGAVALVALWAQTFLEIGGWWLPGVLTMLILIALWRPAWVAQVPDWLHRLAFPGIAAAGVHAYYLEGEWMPAMTQVATLLVAYRAIHYRKRRDELQLIVLGLFLVVSGGVLTNSIGFAVQIMMLTGLALALLMTLTLEGGEAPVATKTVPTWAERVDWFALAARVRAVTAWRVVATGAVLFLSLAVISGLLFLAIPRFELGQGLFLEGLLKRKTSSGFTDTLRFGDVTDILRDQSVAMRVEVSDRSQVPAQVYWRMVVLDEYRDQAFRVSPGLKASAFDKPVTTREVRGAEPPRRGSAEWTFYVEPSAGRFLPLTGGFRMLRLTEPQNLRSSTGLRVIELTRDPVSMKAFRVYGMASVPELRDRTFGSWLRLNESERRARHPNQPTMMEVNLSPADMTILRRVVQEITGGVELPAKEFARRAQAWMGRRHGYSLNIELPPGEGDPLVRWLVSNEPGHCEFFAGGFALLARVAGHPTRVVAGFVGGVWNGDYVIVRNSDAHAWCEIFDGREYWLRVDPTMAATGERGRADEQGLEGATVREEEGGWAAMMDRLRLFWYRRIVNFDERDQRVMVSSLKNSVQDFGRRVEETLKTWLAGMREWLSQPWRADRMSASIGVLLAVIALVWSWRRWGRAAWLRLRSKRSSHGDAERREAGRWLRRLAKVENQAAIAPVRASLERVRYGPRETWPRTDALWREARKLSRRHRL